MQTRRRVLAALSAGVAGVAGCSLPGGDDGVATPAGEPTPPPGSDHYYTHAQPTGNRTLDGAGAVRSAGPVTVEPDGQPEWLVAHPADGGSYWTVVTTDGAATRWRVRDGEATREGTDDSLPADTQPVVATGGGGPRLIRPPADMADRTSPAVADGEPPKLLYVAGDGAVVVAGDERTRLDVDALTDGRPAALGDGRYALFSDPTDRYKHGALGNSTEGTTLTVVDPAGPSVDWRTTLDAPLVFEGLQPLVADLDGDGEPEIVTTVADSADGARIAVFSTAGERLATGPIHEPGWRHQLTVAPFGPDGRPELAVVRKPHVDHLLEFYRLSGGSLDVVAGIEGYSTHTYGSRILDGAVAGDFDADGRVELLLPTTERTELVAVRRTGDGAEAAWRLDPGGPVGSNVTGVALPDGVAVGAASGGAVTVWQG